MLSPLLIDGCEEIRAESCTLKALVSMLKEFVSKWTMLASEC